jgi:hypothetical protein
VGAQGTTRLTQQAVPQPPTLSCLGGVSLPARRHAQPLLDASQHGGGACVRHVRQRPQAGRIEPPHDCLGEVARHTQQSWAQRSGSAPALRGTPHFPAAGSCEAAARGWFLRAKKSASAQHAAQAQQARRRAHPQSGALGLHVLEAEGKGARVQLRRAGRRHRLQEQVVRFDQVEPGGLKVGRSKGVVLACVEVNGRPAVSAGGCCEMQAHTRLLEQSSKPPPGCSLALRLLEQRRPAHLDHSSAALRCSKELAHGGGAVGYDVAAGGRPPPRGPTAIALCGGQQHGETCCRKDKEAKVYKQQCKRPHESARAFWPAPPPPNTPPPPPPTRVGRIRPERGDVGGERVVGGAVQDAREGDHAGAAGLASSQAVRAVQRQRLRRGHNVGRWWTGRPRGGGRMWRLSGAQAARPAAARPDPGAAAAAAAASPAHACTLCTGGKLRRHNPWVPRLVVEVGGAVGGAGHVHGIPAGGPAAAAAALIRLPARAPAMLQGALPPALPRHPHPRPDRRRDDDREKGERPGGSGGCGAGLCKQAVIGEGWRSGVRGLGWGRGTGREVNECRERVYA